MVAPAADSCSHLVMADRMRLKQVLLNLLSNAIKYNRQDGQVAIACRMDGHGLVRIEVHDTGMGLDAQAQAKLFRAFERLQADKTLTEGTGIGLALSRRLMQVMNGDIGMSSELGVGSCFWVQLPAAAATSESPRASDRPTPRALPAPAAPTFEASGTVLCIDDNPVNLALLEALMEDRPGVKMVCTVDPMQGLLLAAELRPDLILLDIQLPEIDGLEVLRRLRAAPATAGIPVIAVSADAMPDMVKHCMDSGFADYVTKPLDADHLFDAVDRELGRVRPPAA
jgi:CheY-like chemotaxis protein